MNAIALTLVLVSVSASAEGSRLRLFVGGSVDAAGNVDGRGSMAVAAVGPGLAVDVGSQLDEEFAIYVSVRGSSAIICSQALGLLMLELSPTRYFSVTRPVASSSRRPSR